MKGDEREKGDVLTGGWSRHEKDEKKKKKAPRMKGSKGI